MMAHGSKPGLRGSRQGELAMRLVGPRYGAGQLASSAVMKRTAGRYGTGQLVPSAAVLDGDDARSTGVCSGLFRCSGTRNLRLERNFYESPERQAAQWFRLFFWFGTSGTANPSPSPLKGERREGLAPPNLSGLAVMADDREQRAAWVRANLPECSAVAAAFRAEFGEVRLVFASENGHVIGKLGPDGVKLSETVVGRMFPEKPEGRR